MTIQSRPATNEYRENFDHVFRQGRRALLSNIDAGLDKDDGVIRYVPTTPASSDIVALVRATRALIGTLPCDRPWTREENALINAVLPFQRDVP